MAEDGGAAFDLFISGIGGFFPIAPWGLVSLQSLRDCSIFDRAASMFM
ncbi:MAG: hypothetical protein AAFQ21_15285 [Pseudomonadota bacterium]